ncbi:hypothetical protein BD324DRAFT_395546 [Kockovaella imperatae]|uniref:DUF8040 domain-containing protein n=1 Tax=Kockovaella imperatae TaxID=4999 RepID=A0A1Y1UJN0_9TREE|nr:hypothetical protein BD324DRAFT_395546 [Kockovaella imperatae]ORX37747.1 hypothetical protein BD324DRAFT_395546 [Kockovaella imperatae]
MSSDSPDLILPILSISTSDDEYGADEELLHLILFATVQECLQWRFRPRAGPTPLHNASFRGETRLQELQGRHRHAMLAVLGLEPPAFSSIYEELYWHGGLRDSRYVSAKEQLAHFLYICREGSGVRRTAEYFDRSYHTIHT